MKLLLTDADVSTPALHNCGPSPRSVYRTASVGSTHELNVLRALIHWEALPAELRRSLTPRRMGGKRSLASEGAIPPELVTGVACHLHEALRDVPPAPGAAARAASERSDAHASMIEEAPKTPHRHSGGLLFALLQESEDTRALRTLASLSRRMEELGWLAPVHGLATFAHLPSTIRHEGRENPGLAPLPWLPTGDGFDALHYAWLACAVSHFAAPLILWTRPPSLTWWRGDGVVTLRWFGDHGDA